jgi:pimeloyl-ACP methyl ester carboxylesterase
MGGLIGMMLAAELNTPIRRLVMNDAGPFIPLVTLKRIGAYVGQSPVFDDLEAVEKYMREVYAPLGDLSDENRRHLARFGVRTMPDNKLRLASDPAIVQPFLALDKDVDLWAAYDRIRCPVLLLHGLNSDILPAPIAQKMTRRGPCAELVEFPKVGHAPALMDLRQILSAMPETSHVPDNRVCPIVRKSGVHIRAARFHFDAFCSFETLSRPLAVSVPGTSIGVDLTLGHLSSL